MKASVYLEITRESNHAPLQHSLAAHFGIVHLVSLLEEPIFAAGLEDLLVQTYHYTEREREKK